MTSRSVAIRDATAEDVQLIFRFIESMAEFDGRLRALQATPEMIREGLFGAVPHAAVLLAEVDGVAVGFASYFRTYSTFLGRPGIWLDDLFVDVEARGCGIGRRCFATSHAWPLLGAAAGSSGRPAYTTTVVLTSTVGLGRMSGRTSDSAALTGTPS